MEGAMNLSSDRLMDFDDDKGTKELECKIKVLSLRFGLSCQFYATFTINIAKYIVVAVALLSPPPDANILSPWNRPINN